MKFLIFDSNVVYAKKVAQLLHEHVKDAEVDLANCLPVLNRRLDNKVYDLIIADVDTTLDARGTAESLNKVGEKTPVIVWSALGDVSKLVGPNKSQVLRKVFGREEMQSTLVEAMLAARV